MSIEYEDGVFEELLDCSAYLADRNEEVAQKFLDECDRTFRLLEANPRLGSPRKFEDPKLSEIRMWRVKNYEKYLIFYLPLADGIKILHIFHSALDYNRVFDDDAA